METKEGTSQLGANLTQDGVSGGETLTPKHRSLWRLGIGGRLARDHALCTEPRPMGLAVQGLQVRARAGLGKSHACRGRGLFHGQCCSQSCSPRASAPRSPPLGEASFSPQVLRAHSHAQRRPPHPSLGAQSRPKPHEGLEASTMGGSPAPT